MAKEEQKKEEGLFAQVSSIVGAIFGKGYLGGELKAAVFQGFNELGTVLGKAFPDSVQIDEPGAAFNPLYRDRDGNTPAPSNEHVPSPSEIATASKGSVHGPQQEHGQDHEQGHGR